MNINFGNRPQTAPLPEFGKVDFNAKLTPQANPFSPSLPGSDLSLNHEMPTTAEISVNKGDSLTSLVIFPDGESPQATGTQAFKGLEIKSPAAVRGERILESLYLRQGVQGPRANQDVKSSGKGYQPFDYAIAKISRDGKSLNVQQLQSTLSTLSERLRGLNNPSATPLSADEVSQINASLKHFGLLTDGLQLYNLTNRVSTVPGQPRRPTVCTPYDLGMLKDVCSALLETKQPIANNTLFGSPVQPAIQQKATAANRFTAPGMSFSDSVRPDPVSLNFRHNSFATDSPLIALSDKMTTYQDLIVAGESLIELGTKELAELMNQQEQVSTDLEIVGRRTETLKEKSAQQQVVLRDLRDIYCQFPDGLPVVRSATEAAQINAKLAIVGLKVEVTADGQTRYLQEGRELTEEQFKQKLGQGVAAQQWVLQGINTDLAQTQNQASQLQQKNQQLGQRVQYVIDDKINPGRTHLQTAHEKATAELQELYAIKQDPQRWAALSPDQQAHNELQIRQIEQDLARIAQGSQRGDRQLQLAETVLRRADELNDIANKLLNQLNQIIKANNHLLADPVLKKAAKTSEQDTQLLALIEKANQLQQGLSLTGNGSVNLSNQTRKWLEETEQFLLEAQKAHQTQTTTESQARTSLDRSLTVLRESLAYHEKKLEQIHQGQIL